MTINWHTILCTNNICIKRNVEKYYQYKLNTLHGKKTKQPVFTVTLIRCIGFNQPPHNLASEQSFYNIVDKADHNV